MLQLYPGQEGNHAYPKIHEWDSSVEQHRWLFVSRALAASSHPILSFQATVAGSLDDVRTVGNATEGHFESPNFELSTDENRSGAPEVVVSTVQVGSRITVVLATETGV